MNKNASCWMFGMATGVENLATVSAAVALLWTLSSRFTVTRREAQLIEAVASIKLVSLAIAWLGAILSLGCLLCLVRGGRSRELLRLKGWGYLSILLTLMVTLAGILTPRVGAIAGPPLP